MSKFEKVGGGSYGVYRPKKTDWGAIFGGIVFFIMVLLVIGAIAG